MNGKPHVCFVGVNNLRVLAPEYSNGFVGGAELQQVLLARALVRYGFRVSMVVADHGQPDGAIWDGITTYKAYRMDEGIPILRFVHPRMTRVWAAMKRADADVYYSSCADIVVSIAAQFARRYNRRAVFRVASDADCDPDKVFFRLRNHRTTWLRLLREKWLYRRGLRRTHLILAQTEGQQQTLLQKFGAASRVLPPLVDGEPERRGFSNREPGVLWVSTIRSLKRPELVFELARRLPELDFTLIGGPAIEDPGYYETVRAQAAKLGNVRMVGFVPFQQTRSYFERARVLINTSAVEGFPNTYLQAWGQGTPVVAFHDPDGAIAQRGLGRKVTNLDEMAEAIAHFNQDPQAWRRASEASAAWFDTTYGAGKTVSSFVEALT